MNHKKSMHIFWLSLCLLLVSGVVIIAAVQYRSHRENDAGEADSASESSRMAGVDDADSEPVKDQAIHPQQTTEPDPVHNYAENAAPLQPAGAAAAEYEFELRISDGQLDVYRYPSRELYFHTGISCGLLTEQQREELQEGKYFVSEQELYGYLESCTS